MPIPIGTIRNASTPGDDTVQVVRRVLLPAGQRAEAIQKLLDMLGRHLSGKEVLPRDALVRLIEDLARVLKFPPLPQETGRAFIRRLVELVESLPLPERLAIERQLGGGSLARRLATLTQSGPSTGSASPTTPLPASHAGIRNLPLQLPMPQHPAAAQTLPAGDLALLQAMLRKTYSADEDGTAAELIVDDTPQAEAAQPDRTAPQRVSAPTARPAQSPTGDGDVATVSGGAVEDATEVAEVMQPAAADTSETAAATVTGDETLPANFEGSEAAGLQASAEPAEETHEQTPCEAEPATQQGAADGFETDGTYGPSRAEGEDRPQSVPTSRAALRESTLADVAAALLEGGLDLPDIVTENRPALASRRAEREPEPTRSTPDVPERLPDGPRSDNDAADDQPLAEPIAKKPEPPSGGSPAVQRPAPAGEDIAMQQAIALLVESGLPEIIPFAMVPYLPAKEDADDGHGKTDRTPRDDREGDAGTEPEDRDEEQKGQDPENGGDETAEPPDSSDAYDLYRKLGGLG
ncbi:hypothetical protein [Ensifer sp. BR816]|uniref:hypothetical protein n=1 Tax=Rhizobium sp. (strain BR816) TaxID=1057002 RepID=UPI000361A0B8|nr:hypothetical protein [Ensifer sp. BR816]